MGHSLEKIKELTLREGNYLCDLELQEAKGNTVIYETVRTYNVDTLEPEDFDFDIRAAANLCCSYKLKIGHSVMIIDNGHEYVIKRDDNKIMLNIYENGEDKGVSSLVANRHFKEYL